MAARCSLWVGGATAMKVTGERTYPLVAQVEEELHAS